MSDTHSMTAITSAGSAFQADPELVAYLRTQPRISPLTATLKDATSANNLVGIVTTSMMVPSGAKDEIGNGDPNYLRMFQGIAGTLNLGWQAYLQFKGRYQTYTDLRDLQAGVDPALIASRASLRNLSRYGRFESWWMANSVNMTAGIAIGMCTVMAASGIASGRPGETATALLWIPGIALRFLPEPKTPAREAFIQAVHATREKSWTQRTGKEHLLWLGDTMVRTDGVIGRSISAIGSAFHAAAKGVGAATSFGAGENRISRFFNRLADQPPLFLSAIYSGARRVPAFVNALFEKDGYQAVHLGGGFAADITLAGVYKGFIGRRNGSIVAAPEGAAAAKAMLEGRIFRSLREMLSPK